MSDRQLVQGLKKLIVSEFLLMLFFIIIFFAHQATAANPLPPDMVEDESGDAIGIKVMPNDVVSNSNSMPSHYSPYAWYLRNAPNKGAPSSMMVDGYEAVRDGRTVYVGAANIEPSDAVDDGTVYTNIYIISYNQDPDPGTTDVFGQLLSFWKFNVMLVEKTGNGLCLPESNINCDDKKPCKNNDVCVAGKCQRYCLLTSDCNSKQYCDSKKSRLIRDVKRMADLFEVNSAIELYNQKNKTYPILKSATYLPGKTVSVWPSWKDTLSKELSAKLPVDPVNKLGPCDGYDSITCWNEKDKKFAAEFETPNVLPPASLAYAYRWDKDNKSFQLCTNYETNYSGLVEERRCDSYYQAVRSESPKIIFNGDLSQNEGPFEAYFQIDSFYDIKKYGISIEPVDPVSWSQWSGWNFGGHGGLWYSATDDESVKMISAQNVDLPQNKPYAVYTFRVTVTDIKGNSGTSLSKIRICNPKICGSNSCGQMQDNCGSILVCPDCPSGSTCNANNLCQSGGGAEQNPDIPME